MRDDSDDSHLDGELNDCVNLVSPVSVVREPLEVDDQHLGQTPEIKLLGGLLVFLTVWTVPGIISPQLLLTRVQLQTLAQIDHLVTKYLRILFKIISHKKIFETSVQKYFLRKYLRKLVKKFFKKIFEQII